MCRHLAYVGPVTPLAALLHDPPHGLLRQSWAPRRQRHGAVNGDGFGVGWWAAGDPVPARYRRARPMWADPSWRDVARVVRSGAVLAAVRSATAGTALDESAAAPFAGDRWLFSHNGAVEGWPGSVELLAAKLPVPALLALETRSDSALVWALVLDLLRAGAPAATALASTVREVTASTPARLNLLLGDGATITATTWGDTLSYRRLGDGVVVASEPFDDDPGWVDVPDRSVLVAARGRVRVSPLDDGPEEPA
jgi:gamma-glutamyl hercynylcysteine S-oxide hydrolase